MSYNAEKIKQVAAKNFGEDFKFRPGQLEAIQDILTCYFSKTVDMYFLEAPTGSGKSLIAMIASAVMEEEGKKGYILTSEITLQKQYEKDLKHYRLGWGTIYGGDNYSCVVNSMPFFLGDCRLRNIGYEAAEGLPCFSECGYLNNRKMSIHSNVSLLNYSYALIQRNYVEDMALNNERPIPFVKRDFVFCDEAHKVTDIVQGHFSPRFSKPGIGRLKSLMNFLKTKGLSYPQFGENEFDDLLDIFLEDDDPELLLASLKRILELLKQGVDCNKELKDIAGKRYEKSKEIPRDWSTAMNNTGFWGDCICKVEDFLEIINQTGLEYMVKTVNLEEAVFNCLDESYMMDKHFHKRFGFKVFMSATMGNPKYFLKTIGGKNGRYNRIRSTFDFEQSPIYLYAGKRMGYKDIDRNLPWLASEVDTILRKHKNESGIIHSGSYHLAKKIYDGLPRDMQKRVLLYDGTDGKITALSTFEREDNLILMGPSLLEGIDLKGDKSRFQLFVKVPYPSLANKFVKRKMETQPEWYRWKTCTSILQGVGRSVREDGDWAVTYILDSCFYDLLKEDLSFPTEFKERIIHLK